MSRARWPAPADPRFAATEYVVDATSTEQQALWWEWSEHYRVPWDAGRSGTMPTIGRVAGRPIVVTVFWATVGPSLVAFVEGTSQLVDYQLVAAWEKAVFPCLSRERRHSNAANFGNVIADIASRHQTAIVDEERAKRILNFWLIDEAKPHADEDPQRAFERCEAKSVEWGEAALFWQERMRKAAR